MSPNEVWQLLTVRSIFKERTLPDKDVITWEDEKRWASGGTTTSTPVAVYSVPLVVTAAGQTTFPLSVAPTAPNSALVIVNRELTFSAQEEYEPGTKYFAFAGSNLIWQGWDLNVTDTLVVQYE